MDFGAHLPLMDFGGNPYTLRGLLDYTGTARELGFSALSVNDHLVFSVPWLDGPTALAAVLSQTGDMTLATTVALPVVRGPVPLAKSLGAVARLAEGRLVVGVGPGSSRQDYDTVGLDFEERWPRFDEAVQVLRCLWSEKAEPFRGRFYATDGIDLQPRPLRPPPIWIGSWGSPAGLRRTARLADGWLASAYNTTPEEFAGAWSRLRALLAEQRKNPATFPNALSTLWFHITSSRSEADAIFRERLLPNISRPEEILRERLPVGPPERLAEKLRAFREAGVQRVFVWPVTDELRQLALFREQVVPLLES